MKTLPVSKAAKKLYSCLRIVYHQRESFELVKNGVPYARLVPVTHPRGNTHDFADDLTRAALRPEDRRGLASAVAKGRRHLKPLNNPWA
jgi:hypothetical protein